MLKTQSVKNLYYYLKIKITDAFNHNKDRFIYMYIINNIINKYMLHLGANAIVCVHKTSLSPMYTKGSSKVK